MNNLAASTDKLAEGRYATHLRVQDIPDNWLSELTSAQKLPEEWRGARCVFQAAGIAVLVKASQDGRHKRYRVWLAFAIAKDGSLGAESCLRITIKEPRLAAALSAYQEAAKELAARRLDGFSIRAPHADAWSAWLVDADSSDIMRLDWQGSKSRLRGFRAEHFTRRLACLNDRSRVADTALLAAWEVHGQGKREELLARHTVATHNELPLDEAFAVCDKAIVHLAANPTCSFAHAPTAVRLPAA